MLKEELKFKYGFEMQETKFSRVSALANETVSCSRLGRKKKHLQKSQCPNFNFDLYFYDANYRTIYDHSYGRFDF